MQLPGSRFQVKRDPLYVADGTIIAGLTAQLLLPQLQTRSLLKLQNLSNGPLWIENGSARATCTISGGKVNSITVTNAGFNFTNPPVVQFLGGGNAGNGSYLGLGQPGSEGPNSKLTAARLAVAHCVLGSASPLPGSLVSSIVIDDPGEGYVTAPFVFLVNSDLDPYGCATPSATSGMLLSAQSAPYILNGTSCHTDSLAIYGATTGQAFLCRWMT